MTADPRLSPQLAIEPSFLDHNGHVNMAFHLVLADTAVDHVFGDLKGADYGKARGMTTFAAETHVRYLKEMRAGDDIRGRVWFADCDAKRVLWAVELVRMSDGETVTTVEGVTMSVSVETRRVTPFPDDVREGLEAAVERDAAGVATLGWLGRRVSMSRD